MESAPSYRPGPIRCRVPTAADMRALGRDLARLTRAGDLVILSGELGAGKTALTQGIGEGLHVTGDVISPTFVLARMHAPAGDGPGLVHADAYRLSGPAEIDDLDLDAWMPWSVTVVEWGLGVADHLSADRLEIDITTADDPADETREVVVTPVGARWDGLVRDWEHVMNEVSGRDAAADAEGADGV